MIGDLDKSDIEKKIKEGWIKVWFAIEVMAIKADVAKSALQHHIEKLERAKDSFLLEKSFSEVNMAENPTRGAKEAYSQVAEVTLLIKNLSTLIDFVLFFGPSSIEVLEPQRLVVKIDEVQGIANAVSGIMHEFASAGIGGLVISPDKKK